MRSSLARSYYHAWVRELHWPLLIVVGLLNIIGFLMMVSAGNGDVHLYAIPQLIRFVFALVLMLILTLVPMRNLSAYAYLLYGIGVITLVSVDIAGHIGMGAQRWIKFGGMNIQPSEFMKLLAILALARYFHHTHAEDAKKLFTLFIPLLIIFIPAVFILRQPNLGTTAILLVIGAMILFSAGLRWRYIIICISGLIAAVPLIWHFLHDYQKQRVLTFLEPEKDPLGAGYNILQSMIAIGAGQFSGKGFMNGSQGQLNFLPEKHTDFIFTMFAEEWGFLGSTILLILYFLLFIYGLSIATHSRTSFGSYVAIGVTTFFFAHVMVNIAMVMGLIPVVGVPLPFLSYGGSIMITSMLAVGLLLNVHMHQGDTSLLVRKNVVL